MCKWIGALLKQLIWDQSPDVGLPSRPRPKASQPESFVELRGPHPIEQVKSVVSGFEFDQVRRKVCHKATPRRILGFVA